MTPVTPRLKGGRVSLEESGLETMGVLDEFQVNLCLSKMTDEGIPPIFNGHNLLFNGHYLGVDILLKSCF